jgi:Zn-dependent protease
VLADLLARAWMLVPLLAGLTIHEWAHAAAALQLGDDTALRQGRLTLNPLAHLDPIGSLLPLLGVPFGWARPVPIDTNRFRPEVPVGTGLLLTALAGPMANLALALFASGLLRAIDGAGLAAPLLSRFLLDATAVNVALAVFNLLPIPPLDGSRVVDGLVPYEWRPLWERAASLGWVLLAGLLLLGQLCGVGLGSVVSPLVRLLSARG